MIFAFGCTEFDHKVHNIITKQSVLVPSKHQNKISEGLVDGCYGIVAINEKQSFKDTFSFNLYNIDKTLWKRIIFSADSNSVPHVVPYALKCENFVMMFRCTAVGDGFYKVITDENKKTEKLISVREKFLVFEKWPQHILKHAFAVDFSTSYNPLRSDTTGGAKRLRFNNNQNFHPVEIKGYWLKVKDDNEKGGWVRWRNEKGELLVTVFYLC
ncbi:hypothetical protein HQ865_19225 [Mucilaginibacter mali]|uniref:Uncharacterized protein n=1 Tax=Mucilaginibacter mali TaxID=2740462 RepID=A0A7D4Q5P0_9SPHI|nr:hypothetical protein [Mucilaginibacter mali]QKJ31807.1 hypothetical protein HQ865_19225 [Mucilaginibacter mali]